MIDWYHNRYLASASLQRQRLFPAQSPILWRHWRQEHFVDSTSFAAGLEWLKPPVTGKSAIKLATLPSWGSSCCLPATLLTSRPHKIRAVADILWKTFATPTRRSWMVCKALFRGVELNVLREARWPFRCSLAKPAYRLHASFRLLQGTKSGIPHGWLQLLYKICSQKLEIKLHFIFRLKKLQERWGRLALRERKWPQLEVFAHDTFRLQLLKLKHQLFSVWA